VGFDPKVAGVIFE